MSTGERSAASEYTLLDARDDIRDLKSHITEVEDRLLKRMDDGFKSNDERFDAMDARFDSLLSINKRMVNMLLFLTHAAALHHKHLGLDNDEIGELAKSLGLTQGPLDSYADES